MAKLSFADEVICFNGKIITVDNNSRVAQAMLIRDGKFLAIGSNEEILALATPATQQVDLCKHTVIPGLIDAHFRLLDRATAQRYGANISLAHNVQDMLDAVREAAGRTPKGEVITSNSGWYPSMLEERRDPSRAELDSAAPEHIVILRGESEFLYLNSYALKHFNITRDTPQPEYGWIEKDAQTGEPTGVLMGGAAELLGNIQVRFSDDQKREALSWALQQTTRAGVTSIREGGISIDNVRIYHQLYRRGELPLRTSMQLGIDMSPGADEINRNLSRFYLNAPMGDRWFQLDRSAYFFADDDYNRTNLGGPIFNQRVPRERIPRFNRVRSEGSIDKMEQVVSKMAELGLSGGILAGGDLAVDAVLDMMERVNEKHSLVDKRWILSQVFYLRERHLQRIKALGMVLTPMWHHYYYYPALSHYHGEDMAQTMDPFRMMLESGAHVGMGSDVSSIPLNYFAAIYFLHTRNSWKWGKVNAEQAISREQALRLLTINNAFVSFEEDYKGSIESGKLADFVVLSDDLMTVPEQQIPEIYPLLTVVGGKAVFQHENFSRLIL